MTLTVVTRRSTSWGDGVSVLLLVSVMGSGSDSLEAQTVSLILITSSTSLLSGSKQKFFNPKESSYMLLASIITGKFFAYYLELCNIVTFLFLTLKLKAFSNEIKSQTF
jgi:hypothetical protein